jgi:hypothetical protein
VPARRSDEETVRIVRERRQLLRKFDPDLLRELDRANRDEITILADGSYCDGVSDADGSIIIVFQ